MFTIKTTRIECQSETRCLFDGFPEKTDFDPQTGKPGVRCHNFLTAIFLRIFGKITELESGGKTIYLNTNSLNKWLKRHRDSSISEELTSIRMLNQIIENRRNKARKDNAQNSITLIVNTFTVGKNMFFNKLRSVYKDRRISEEKKFKYGVVLAESLRTGIEYGKEAASDFQEGNYKSAAKKVAVAVLLPTGMLMGTLIHHIPNPLIKKDSPDCLNS